MRLFWPSETPTASLPSLWTAAEYPIDSDANDLSHTSQLQDNKLLPFHLLSAHAPVDGEQVLTGSETQASYGAIRDYCFKQAAVYGIPVAAPGGLIPYLQVFGPTFFGMSCYSLQDYGGPGISGTALMPVFIYVYRPSTQSVVGFLAKPRAGWFRGMVYWCTRFLRGGAGGSGNSTAWNYGIVESTKDAIWTRGNVTAQAGDYVCYEMWGASYTQWGSLTKTWTITYDARASPAQAWTYESPTYRNGTTFFWWDLSQAVEGGVTPGFPYTQLPVNLTNVTPGTGPRLSLTFDGVVTADSTVIGAASSGIGVSSVTEVSTTAIDLNVVVAPGDPTGAATNEPFPAPVGEAEPVGPPVPTGGEATPV